MGKERAREQEIQRKENLLINIRVTLSITSVLENGDQLTFFADFLYYNSSRREENFINMGGGRWGVGSKSHCLVNELKKRVRTAHGRISRPKAASTI